MNWLKSTYRIIVDHLTKVLGIIGAAFMAFSAIDASTVESAAQMYLSPKWVRSIGVFLFALVIARGWWTGWKAKQK